MINPKLQAILDMQDDGSTVDIVCGNDQKDTPVLSDDYIGYLLGDRTSDMEYNLEPEYDDIEIDILD
jgi:hypothetical protein